MVSGQNDEPLRYIYNPTTNMFDSVEGQTQASVKLEDISNGRYTTGGRVVWDNVKGQVAVDLKPTENNYLTHYPLSNHLEIYVPTPVDEINDRFYQRAGHAIGADFEGYTSEGVSTHFQLDYSLVSPPGQVLYYNGGSDWKHSYIWVPYDPDNPNVRVRYGDSYYDPASNSDTIEYMLRGLLYGQYESQIQQMINSGMEDENGEPIDSISSAVAYLVRTNLASVIASRFTYLDL